MTSYPIIEQRSLPKAQRGGLWGLRAPTRPVSELPLPNAHEAVVYKSGGSCLVDDGRSRLDDDHVVNATNITVVDMREDAPVTVHASIPSGGAAEFKVQVAFLCTVRRPEEVVESGLKDMEDLLTQYLVRHQPLFHVGESYEFDEINEVRRNVTAEVKAYVSMRPPRFRGIDVTLGSIQVLTPDEYAEFERQRRERRREGMLNSEEQRQLHSLAQEREQLQQIREVEKQRYEQEIKAQEEVNGRQLAEMRRDLDEALELQKRRHEQLVAEIRQQMDHTLSNRQLTHDHQAQSVTLAHDQRMRSATTGYDRDLQWETFEHERRLRSAAIDHAIGEAGKLTDAIGADRSEVPTLLAAGAGEHTISQAAELLGKERERRRETEAGDALRDKAWAREDEQRREAWDREDGLRDQDRAHEETGYKRQAEREDRQLKYKFKLQELQAQVQVLSAGISRGLADHHTIDKLMGVVSGAVQELESGADPDSASAAFSSESSAAPSAARRDTVNPAADEHAAGVAETIIEAEIVSDNQVPDDSEFREEDLGR